MKLARRFAYGADPVCLVACALYAVNVLLIRPRSEVGSIWRTHFDDLLLIPAALPLVLWLQRKLKLRAHDGMPRAGEIALHTVIWALMAEVVGPFFLRRGTADLCDVVCYLAGALVGYVLWRSEKSLAASHEHP